MNIGDRFRPVLRWLLPLLLLFGRGLLAAQVAEHGAQSAKTPAPGENASRQNDSRPNEESLRGDIVSNPNDAAAHGALAAFYASTGRYEEALFEWGRAAQNDPDDSRYSLAVADTLIALRRFPVARDFLAAIAHRFGTLAYYHYDLGLVYYGLRDFASGLKEFQAARKADPSLHQAIFFEGNCLAATGELDEAAEKYQQALQESTGNPQYLFALGKVRFLQGPEHLAAAANWLSAAHEARPGDIATRFYLALAKESSGDLGTASKLLEKVVAERPDEMESRIALARIYRRLGDTAKSREMSEAVRRLREQREAPPEAKP